MTEPICWKCEKKGHRTHCMYCDTPQQHTGLCKDCES
jgi:hypothetical protein